MLSNEQHRKEAGKIFALGLVLLFLSLLLSSGDASQFCVICTAPWGIACLIGGALQYFSSFGDD